MLADLMFGAPSLRYTIGSFWIMHSLGIVVECKTII